MCRVEVDIDPENSDSKEFDVFVRVPPKNVVLDAAEQPQLDKPINFTCNSDGKPSAKYRLLKCKYVSDNFKNNNKFQVQLLSRLRLGT